MVVGNEQRRRKATLVQVYSDRALLDLPICGGQDFGAPKGGRTSTFVLRRWCQERLAYILARQVGTIPPKIA